MNYQYAMTLANESIMTVSVSILASPQCVDPDGKLSTDLNKVSTRYTYLTNQELEKGDLILIPAKNSVALGIVEDVHEIPHVEPTSTKRHKWVISKVNLTDYQRTIDYERKFNDKMRKNVRKNLRQRHLEQFKEEYGEVEIPKLSIKDNQ